MADERAGGKPRERAGEAARESRRAERAGEKPRADRLSERRAAEEYLHRSSRNSLGPGLQRWGLQISMDLFFFALPPRGHATRARLAAPPELSFCLNISMANRDGTA